MPPHFPKLNVFRIMSTPTGIGLWSGYSGSTATRDVRLRQGRAATARGSSARTYRSDNRRTGTSPSKVHGVECWVIQNRPFLCTLGWCCWSQAGIEPTRPNGPLFGLSYTRRLYVIDEDTTSSRLVLLASAHGHGRRVVEVSAAMPGVSMGVSTDNAPRAGPARSLFTPSYTTLVQQAMHAQVLGLSYEPRGYGLARVTRLVRCHSCRWGRHSGPLAWTDVRTKPHTRKHITNLFVHTYTQPRQAVTTFAFPVGEPAVPADAPRDCVADMLEHGCHAFAALPLMLPEGIGGACPPGGTGDGGGGVTDSAADAGSFVTSGGGTSGSFGLGSWRQPLGVLVIACGPPPPPPSAASLTSSSGGGGGYTHGFAGAYDLLRDVDTLQQVAAAVTLTLSAAMVTNARSSGGGGFSGGGFPAGGGGGLGGGGFLAWLSGCLRRLAEASSLHALVWELGEALAAHVRQRFLLDVAVTAALLPDTAGGAAAATSARGARSAYLLTAEMPAPAAASGPAVAAARRQLQPPSLMHSGAYNRDRSAGVCDLSGYHGGTMALEGMAAGSRGGGVPSAGAPRIAALGTQQLQQQQQPHAPPAIATVTGGVAAPVAVAGTGPLRCESPTLRAGGGSSPDKYASAVAAGPRCVRVERAG